MTTAAAADVAAAADLVDAADDRHPRSTSVTDRFDRIVDLKAAGADATGKTPIDSVLSEYVRDDTLVVLPDGEYTVQQIGFYATSNWGLVAGGDDVTIIATADRDGVFAGGYRSRDIWLDGFTLDVTNIDSAPISIIGYGRTDVRNIDVEGRYDDTESPALLLRPLDADTTYVAENVSIPGGGNCVGVYINHDEGRVVLRDCHIEGFWNNGVYASSANAPLVIDGGVYRNNNVANIRVGSHDTVIRDATIEVTDEPDHWHHYGGNMRGIRIVDGPASGRITIDGCDIDMTGAQGVGAFVSENSAGDYVLKNTRIRVDDDYKVKHDSDYSSFAINTYGVDGDDCEQRIENVSITGDAETFMAARFRRSNTTIRNVCMHQPNRNGISFQHGSDNTVTDSTINVDGYTVKGSASVDDVSESGTCPVPDSSSTTSTVSDSAGSIPGTIQAEDYTDYHDRHGGVDTQEGDTRDDTPNVGWMKDGEWLEYDVSVTSGTYDVVADVAGEGSPGSLDISLDGEHLTRIDVPDTGGWQDWEFVENTGVDIAESGDATLRIEVNGDDMNFNRIEFKQAAGASIPGTIQAEDYTDYHDRHGGVDTEHGDTRDDTPNVGWMKDGEWLEYDVSVTSGTYDVVADVAGEGSPGSLDVSLDGEHLTRIDVPDTGGWQNWEFVVNTGVDVSASGGGTLRVEVNGGDMNLNRITFRAADGRHIPGIVQAEDYTDYHDRHGGVDTEHGDTRDDTPNVGWMKDGEWLEYDVSVTSSTYDIVADVAGEGSPGSLDVSLDGEHLTRIDVPDTGGWQNWEFVTDHDVDISARGDATLRVEVNGDHMNFNRLEFR